MNWRYCLSLTNPYRLPTREVRCGSVSIGGNNPIRVQTMTTTDTMDTQATVAQCIRCIEAGSELVRITAPSIREAENLRNIRDELRRRGYTTPLVADIHFTPNAAEIAARIVEKVRINPGNYADKKKFEQKEYSDAQYAAELERIRDRFVPLVRICKQYGTAMRIGTNHGSLSDRIMNRYGDTPLGMVESAWEFVRIAEDESFYNIVLSMKASNPQVMIQAYRLLVSRMLECGRIYPLHLGVTEAGDGLDGRIKSAIGIATLLADGIGDTVRVSLTEEPEAEIPVARKLVNLYALSANAPAEKLPPKVRKESPINPFAFQRRNALNVGKLGSRHVPVVVGDLSRTTLASAEALLPLGYRYNAAADKWTLSDQAADFVYCGSQLPPFALPGSLGILLDYDFWKHQPAQDQYFPLLRPENCQSFSENAPAIWLQVRPAELDDELIDWIKQHANTVMVLYADGHQVIPALRQAFFRLHDAQVLAPVVLRLQVPELDSESFALKAAGDAGALFSDGWGDGLWLSAANQPAEETINPVAFSLLQGCRLRISRTEYISCPSCGRTLFDLMETTARIRARTHHLKGVKIAIMGCIVNGPGEMADADYGYVGSGPGKVTLYRGKEIVRRNIDAENAVDELIDLIRENGNWVDAPEEQ